MKTDKLLERAKSLEKFIFGYLGWCEENKINPFTSDAYRISINKMNNFVRMLHKEGIDVSEFEWVLYA